MLQPYPLLFEPLLKPRVWGGRRLERFGKRLPEGAMIGESWELADLPPSIDGGQSVIANGALRGRTLHEAMGEHGEMILGCEITRNPPGAGERQAAARFPLLIKYLDARQNLSVQVHPSPAYAAAHPQAHLKSEAWVVIDAEPGAVIYKGLGPGVTRERFARHIRAGSRQVADDLNAVAVKPGDCHYLPSGVCHALGAGILVAEVQTPSDTTFRVYDWGRASTGRQLHIEAALECIDFAPGEGDGCPRPSQPHPPHTWRGITSMPLTATEYFEIERVDVKAEVAAPAHAAAQAAGAGEAGAGFPLVTQEQPQVIMMIAGSGRVEGDFGEPVSLQPGTTMLLPAAAEGWQAKFHADSWLLIVRLPSPLRNILALRHAAHRNAESRK